MKWCRFVCAGTLGIWSRGGPGRGALGGTIAAGNAADGCGTEGGAEGRAFRGGAAEGQTQQKEEQRDSFHWRPPLKSFSMKSRFWMCAFSASSMSRANPAKSA